ncbi:MAG TPA: hypothetical protein QF620_02545 [Candidatus Paceibacterota bacterium]|jgi:hypothetical protein|nr:hypothetical protein [Candidatus Paceibacterota bacterium]|tara:strand:+ start:148 stop:603 length:456 start_codon:yes stop_codon:yes gene_type:complete
MKEIPIDDLNKLIELIEETKKITGDECFLASFSIKKNNEIAFKYFPELKDDVAHPVTIEFKSVSEESTIIINTLKREVAPISAGPCADPFPDQPERITFWTKKEPDLIDEQDKEIKTGEWTTLNKWSTYKVYGPVVTSNLNFNYLDIIIYQ